jgi:hypothetical protein
LSHSTSPETERLFQSVSTVAECLRIEFWLLHTPRVLSCNHPRAYGVASPYVCSGLNV